jgi:DNA-binding transcriptional ArsR family regulator
MFADPLVPPTITEIAFDAGVSQPRASQVVAALAKLELAYRSEDGRWHAHRSELFERFVAEYRGPGGSLHYFYSLDEPLHSATVLVRRLNDHASEPPSVLVSGDVAADEIVPWRRPSHLVLYSRSVPHEMPGIVPAHGPADSNVRIRVPEDRSVWLGARLHPSAGLPLADAAQIVWDLRDLGGEDRADHAGRLVERIVSQW